MPDLMDDLHGRILRGFQDFSAALAGFASAMEEASFKIGLAMMTNKKARRWVVRERARMKRRPSLIHNGKKPR